MYRYNKKFYEYIEKTKMDESLIIPLIIQWVMPKSIIDFGCGEGAWLREALRQNNKLEILGIDGDYIDEKRLKIPRENFFAFDLRKRIFLNRKFDLAISTEVAEHLEADFADIFVENVTEASDQILFSAAIPGQGGTHHINEQWQAYWIDKFEKKGYYCDYSIRNYFWDEPKISSWRRQNLLFFSKRRQNIAPIKQIKNVIHPSEIERLKKDFEKRLEHYITYPEIYIKLDRVIANLLNDDEKIVIYPYGLNGQLCEKILCLKYNIENYIIADNEVKEKGKKYLMREN